MRRRRGMGVLLDAIEYMFAGGCLLAMNFVFMFLFGLLRNLPEILRGARAVLREILILTYRMYRPLLERLEPFGQRHLGIQIATGPLRTLATSLLSLFVLLALLLILRWRITLVPSLLALLHGATVGLLWDELERPDGMRTGERIS